MKVQRPLDSNYLKTDEFSRTHTPAQDLEVDFSYKRKREDADGYIKKIELLVDRLLQHK